MEKKMECLTAGPNIQRKRPGIVKVHHQFNGNIQLERVLEKILIDRLKQEENAPDQSKGNRP